jgi:hypothetical protein
MATSYLDFDKTISQQVELKKGCYQFSFDYAVNDHEFDAKRKVLSYFDVVFNKKTVHKVTATNTNIKKFSIRLNAAAGWNNITIIGKNTVFDQTKKQNVRTYRSVGLDNFKL